MSKVGIYISAYRYIYKKIMLKIDCCLIHIKIEILQIKRGINHWRYVRAQTKQEMLREKLRKLGVNVE